MNRFLLFLFLILSVKLSAQKPVVIKFDKSVLSDQKLELFRYFKGKTEKIKTYSRDSQDSIVVGEFKYPGLYMISFKSFDNKAEFIYNPNENIILDVDMELSNGQIGISNSKENKCYSDLIKINTAYNTFLDSLQNTKRNLHQTTPDFYGRCFYLDSLYEAVAQEKNGRLTFLQFSYPGTFTSEVLVPLSLIPLASIQERANYQTPDAYIRYFFFKYAIIDDRLLYHYVIEDAILNYLSKYSKPEELDIKKSIDYITGTFKKDTAVSSYVSNFMIKTFLDAKTPEMALYVMGQAGEGCSFDIEEKQGEYLSNYSHVQLGSLVDDIVLNDVNGQPVSLSNTCKKGEYTLLLFWTSWCAHCKKMLPELKELLSIYKTKINVFAVSLDENKEEWTNFINSNDLGTWIHVSELKSIPKSSLAPRFMVTHTPTIYLLGKDRKIVAKNLNKDQLIAELQLRLK